MSHDQFILEMNSSPPEGQDADLPVEVELTRPKCPTHVDPWALSQAPSEILQTALMDYQELALNFYQCAKDVNTVLGGGNPARIAIRQFEENTNIDLKIIDLAKHDNLDQYIQWMSLDKAEREENANENKHVRALISVVDEMIRAEKRIREVFPDELLQKAGSEMVEEFEQNTKEVAECKANFMKACNDIIYRKL
ncbi:hypothetical protein D6C98_10113 [Aureobasidium pullulans]|uniref:Uncharacterized protein n=1 Tax=Aureobasidium pullulans TaxID=5580 RepID=A0A4T0A861_AURPU|nr:hypothetical protein D6D26_08100 [Aureobasidium pullulans]THW25027.1 hypothetical protein D6D23_04716 [Aureobasidium pullulans]THY02830.1 hypothetical protein D6D03_04864 [Aureobasidium pullulans]THY15387.1 hypothetical protein D6D00_09366 [Aureobasidium pullulans]THY39162.1 hypothetical protein D6C98_10113 [Aureobasidium pullulans]